MFEHQTQIRVYYADTDAQGIVYHANYLRFFELARTESLRSIGIKLPTFIEEYGVQFAVVEITVKFHKPARLDDELLIVSKISHIGRASIHYQQSIYFAGQNKELVCSADVRLVTVDKQMHPQAVPDALKRGILNDH